MKFLAQKKPVVPILLGVELTNKCMKVVEVAYSNGQFNVTNFSMLTFDPAIDKLIQLRSFFDRGSFQAKQACLGVELSSVVSKTVELDATLSEEEIEIQVHARADHYFNYPSNQLLIDFELMGPSKQKPGLIDIRWIAARKSDIDKKIQFLMEVGITTTIVDINSYALQRMTNSIQDQNLTLTFYLDDKQLLSVLADKETIIHSKQEEIGEGTSAKTITEMMRLVQFYSGMVLPKLISTLYFSGHSAADWIKKLDTHVAIPLSNLNAALATCPIIDGLYSPYQIPNYLLALGLAMRVNGSD